MGSDPVTVCSPYFELSNGAAVGDMLADMPRAPRLIIPGLPMHIVQRGNNRQSCFSHYQDYALFLEVLNEEAETYGVAVHAFVLMTNHVHLLVTPSDCIGPSRMMQQLGRRYVRFFNKKYKRTGTLWEGRFHASIIDSNHYLFATYRYIEMNPVRAGMVASPKSYRWSSHLVNAWGVSSTLISPRQEWDDLGNKKADRCSQYRRIFDGLKEDQYFDAIRFGTSKGLPVGPRRFRKQVEVTLNVVLGSGIPGRPRSKSKTGSEPNN